MSTVKYSEMHGDEFHRYSMCKLMQEEGFFAKSFAVQPAEAKKIRIENLPNGIGELSDSFSFDFENTGVMKDGIIYSSKTVPAYDDGQITLGDIMEDGDIDKQFFIPEERLYYTYPDINHSDETKGSLEKEQRQTWQYIKGGKKINCKAANGHEYVFKKDQFR